MQKTGWMQKLLHEMKEYWLVVIYLGTFFSTFSMYRRLILAQYEISYEQYGESLIKALVLGKVFLVAETLKLGRQFDDKPLVVPTLYKGVLFTFVVALYTIVEALVSGLIRTRGLMEAIDEVMSIFTYEWCAGAIVVFFAFIPFFAMRELSRVLGKGKLRALFFRRRSALEPNRD